MILWHERAVTYLPDIPSSCKKKPSTISTKPMEKWLYVSTQVPAACLISLVSVVTGEWIFSSVQEIRTCSV